MARAAGPAPDETARRRADLRLVELGLFESRARAQDAIAAGLVSADGHVVRKASETLSPHAAIAAAAPHPWVSRGGVKLAAALDRFGIDPAGQVCLDVGASTGGFTDVLLGRGAARVYAVDVGQGQLHPRLAADSRVVSVERTDARDLDARLVPDPVAVCVADVSFISLRLVLPALMNRIKIGGQVVALVKPQFEVGREAVGRGGIVRDEAAQRAALDGIVSFAAGLGLSVLGTMPSPIVGGDGNREFLVAARLG